MCADMRSEFGTKPWKNNAEPVFRFWTHNETEEVCWGFPFHVFSLGRYTEADQTVKLEFPFGTVVVTGPKALHFFECFAAGKATDLRADGVDIINVELLVRKPAG